MFCNIYLYFGYLFCDTAKSRRLCTGFLKNILLPLSEPRTMSVISLEVVRFMNRECKEKLFWCNSPWCEWGTSRLPWLPRMLCSLWGGHWGKRNRWTSFTNELPTVRRTQLRALCTTLYFGLVTCFDHLPQSVNRFGLQTHIWSNEFPNVKRV
jgi:hypothetical protein